MSYRGTVKNGVVVLPPEVKLPEGTAVEVIPESVSAAEDPFVAAIQKAAKPRPHWPKDFTRTLDHYLYGGPKGS